MNELFSLTHCLEYAATTVVVTVLLLLCSGKLLGGLQQSGYSVRRLYRWLARKDNMLMSSYLLLAMMILLVSLILGIGLAFFAGAAYLSLLALAFFCILFCYADARYALKVKTVRTHRFLRLSVLYVIVLAAFTFGLVLGMNALSLWLDRVLVTACRYVPLFVLPVALPVVAAVANFLDKLYELPRNAVYVNRAERKIADSSLIKIGITGSFAKTSVKNILSTVLSEKYRVLATPASYNTPLGIARTVNRTDLSQYDVLIAEMGARHVGDIEKLCEMVMPDYSIITGICPQHLQSFGSLENIIKAKGEILYGTQQGAVMGRDEYTMRLYNNSPVETLLVGDEVGVSDVVATAGGTTFTLRVEERTATVHTKLLGRHTADNMAVVALLAYMLDFTLEEIVRGLEKVDYIPHRLQPIVNGGVTILDDSYNTNVNGARAAIEVLRMFPGNKMVVTPGLVELGVLEESENRAFGECLVGLDHVLLVGDTLVKSIAEGYKNAGGEPEKLEIFPTLAAAQQRLQELLQSGDTVLFLNDLPDVYNV